MKHWRKVRLALAAVIVGAVSVAGLPADASTPVGTAILAGTGTSSTGLVGGWGSFTYNATGALVTNDTTVDGLLACSVTGDDAGDFNGTCSTAGGSASVSGTFTRIGLAVTASGVASGSFNGSLRGDCGLMPTGLNTGAIPPQITSFSMSCVLALNSTITTTGFGAGVMSGSGTSTGMSQLGDWGSFTYSSSGVAATTRFQGAVSCTEFGDTTGGFNGTCTAGASTSSVTGRYTRAGAAVTVAGTLSGGAISGPFSGGCVLVPTGVIPAVPPIITSFELSCVLSLS